MENADNSGQNDVAEHIIVTTENESETTLPVVWTSTLESSDNQTSRMKVIGQRNETLGDISISHNQLMTLLANKSENGIVTLHLQNGDGVTNPVQLQIVPEDQLFQPFIPPESSETREDVKPPESVKVHAEEESTNSVTPVLQLSREDLQSLVRDPSIPVKSLVFKQIHEDTSKHFKNCLESDPTLKKYIKLRPYVTVSRHEIMNSMPVSNKKNSDKFKCNRCEKSFTFAGNLKRHIINIHRHNKTIQSFECQYCNKLYSRHDYMMQHVKSVHEKLTVFKCDVCGKEFTQKGSMTRHVEAVHLDLRRYYCKYCSYRAQSLNDLKKHAASAHLNRTRYECVICGHKAWSASTLKIHVTSSHPSTVKQIKCKYCGLMVDTSKEHYYAHVKSCKTIYNGKPKTKSKSSGKQKKSKVEENDPMTIPMSQHDESYEIIPASDDCMIPWGELCNISYEDVEESQISVTEGYIESIVKDEGEGQAHQWDS